MAIGHTGTAFITIFTFDQVRHSYKIDAALIKCIPMSNRMNPMEYAFFSAFSTNHHPISSLEWNRNGSLLVSVSLSDSNAILWDVDSNRNIPLKRIGMPCALAKWSPNNQRLFTSTVGGVFRVWKTNKWAPERWTIPSGSIQSAAWSPCSNYLLFVTTNDTVLYSLCFLEEQLFGGMFDLLIEIVR